MKYPKSRDVDWEDLAKKSHEVLKKLGIARVTRAYYEDAFIKISEQHVGAGVGHQKYFEVVRKPMPDHPDGNHLCGSNPFYMEHDGECIRTHGEGRYVYQHIIDLAEAL